MESAIEIGDCRKSIANKQKRKTMTNIKNRVIIEKHVDKIKVIATTFTMKIVGETQLQFRL